MLAVNEVGAGEDESNVVVISLAAVQPCTGHVQVKFLLNC